jgi:hypothetical protein
MFKLPIGTCVWLGVGKNPGQLSLLDVFDEMVRLDMLTQVG